MCVFRHVKPLIHSTVIAVQKHPHSVFRMFFFVIMIQNYTFRGRRLRIRWQRTKAQKKQRKKNNTKTGIPVTSKKWHNSSSRQLMITVFLRAFKEAIRS